MPFVFSNRKMSVYLDYAATTPLDGEVLQKMLPYMTEHFGNPDSLHAYGRRAAYAVTCARDTVAQVLGVQANEVYFTSGGTEADNWAVRTLSNGKGVAVSAIEHHAVLGAGEHVRAQKIACDTSGMVGVQALQNALNADTGLVCVMAVNNETGVVQPVSELSKACREHGVLLFSDCVQAGNTQNLKEIVRECDAISLSSHKIYGPKGVGVLVVKNGVKVSPLISGGEQERGKRGGTLNVAGIVGFAYALEKAQALREEFCKRAEGLRNRLEERLIGALGERIKIDGKDAPRTPCVSHITFYGEGAGQLLNKLDLQEIACSGGAACAAHSALPSHVMLAMGRGEEEAKNAIRFSLGRQTTQAEIDKTADTIIKLMQGR